MAMLGVQRKEKELRPYQEKMDIPTRLKKLFVAPSALHRRNRCYKNVTLTTINP